MELSRRGPLRVDKWRPRVEFHSPCRRVGWRVLVGPLLVLAQGGARSSGLAVWELQPCPSPRPLPRRAAGPAPAARARCAGVRRSSLSPPPAPLDSLPLSDLGWLGPTILSPAAANHHVCMTYQTVVSTSDSMPDLARRRPLRPFPEVTGSQRVLRTAPHPPLAHRHHGEGSEGGCSSARLVLPLHRPSRSPRTC